MVLGLAPVPMRCSIVVVVVCDVIFIVILVVGVVGVVVPLTGSRFHF